MTRSTIVLSLITLLALGGCNAPADESASSTAGKSSEQLADQAKTDVSAADSVGTAPPPTVSQPKDNSSADTTSSLPEPTDADAGKAKDNTSANSSSADTSAADKPTDSASGTASSAESSNTNASGNSDTASEATASEVTTPEVTVQAAQAEIKDTSIVPGQKVGVVTAGTTYDQLEKEFGSDRLTTGEIHLGEGFMAPSTKVTLDDGYSFNVVWADESRTQPSEVRELGSSWNLQGIHNGMSFEDLKASLGDFELFGFAWDYGGTLLLEGTPLAPYQGKLFIRVQPSQKAVETEQEKFFAVAGDSAFASSNANFSDLEISVVEMVVRLN